MKKRIVGFVIGLLLSVSSVYGAQAPVVIPNGTGAQFRTNTNNALGALISNNSGASAPSTTYAYMFWVDTSTTPPTIRMRNGANTAWVAIGTINDTGPIFYAANSSLLNGFASSQSPIANQIPVLDSSGNYPANAAFPNGITVPTQTTGDNTTKAANDIFVNQSISASHTWSSIPYASGNFSTGSSMTWTVDSGDVQINEYYVIGKVLHWTLWISQSTIGGTLSSRLIVNLPSGTSVSKVGYFGLMFYDNNGTGGTGVVYAPSVGAGYIYLFKGMGAPNYTSSSNAFSVMFSIDLDIQ